MPSRIPQQLRAVRLVPAREVPVSVRLEEVLEPHSLNYRITATADYTDGDRRKIEQRTAFVDMDQFSESERDRLRALLCKLVVSACDARLR